MVIDHRYHANGSVDADGFPLHLALVVLNLDRLGCSSALLERVVVFASISDVTAKVSVDLLASSTCSFLRSLMGFDVESFEGGNTSVLPRQNTDRAVPEALIYGFEVGSSWCAPFLFFFPTS